MSVIDLGHVPAADIRDSDGTLVSARTPSSEVPSSASPLLPERGERTGVTLPELLYLAEHLGVALPFAAPSTQTDTLATRLGAGRAPLPDFLAAFPDPQATLLERGLLAGPRTAPDPTGATGEGRDAARVEDSSSGLDPSPSGEPGQAGPYVVLPWLAHALQVLNGAEVSVDLEVSLGGATVRSWHHAAADVVTALSSANGVIYEVALLPVARWHDELERVVIPLGQSDQASPVGAPQADRASDGSPLARLSGDGAPSDGGASVPDGLQVPLELLMAGVQALEEGKTDVVNELLGRYAGQSTLPGAPAALDDVEVLRHLQSLSQASGRFRALVTSRNTTNDTTTRSAMPAAAGVLSWVLLVDGWRHLNPIGTKADPQVRLDRVQPADLGPCLSPLIAQVLP